MSVRTGSLVGRKELMSSGATIAVDTTLYRYSPSTVLSVINVSRAHISQRTKKTVAMAG